MVGHHPGDAGCHLVGVEAGDVPVDLGGQGRAGRTGQSQKPAPSPPHGEAVERAQLTIEVHRAWLGGVEREADQARRGLQGAAERLVDVVGHFGEVEAAVTRRETWMAEHPTEVGWKADLSERVDGRRRELALAAEENPSFHVLRLVGPPPLEDDARERWLTSAGALEGYREQWRVEPDHVGHEGNLRGAQALAWEDVQLQLDSGLPALDWLQWAPPSLGPGLELEL